MDDIELKYSDYNCAYSKEEVDLFFEYQNIIKEDLKRIYNLISDYSSSKAKNNLLFELNIAINDICRNRFPDGPFLDLDIHIYENYLVFSYWKLDKAGRIVLDTPSIAIITRDMKNFYFIDEVKIIIGDPMEEDYNNIGLDKVNYYTKEKNTIIEHSIILKNRTGNLFYDCLKDTSSFIKKL